MTTYARRDDYIKSPLGLALAGAQVYVCTQPATLTNPPTPLATIYNSSTGAITGGVVLSPGIAIIDINPTDGFFVGGSITLTGITNASFTQLNGTWVITAIDPEVSITISNPLLTWTVQAQTSFTGTAELVQPLVADGFGHTFFYADSSVPYTIVVVYSGAIEDVLPDQAIPTAGGGGGAGPGLQYAIPWYPVAGSAIIGSEVFLDPTGQAIFIQPATPLSFIASLNVFGDSVNDDIADFWNNGGNNLIVAITQNGSFGGIDLSGNFYMEPGFGSGSPAFFLRQAGDGQPGMELHGNGPNAADIFDVYNNGGFHSFWVDYFGNTHINLGLYDSTGSVGTSGQVLSSTGSQVLWVAAGGGGSPSFSAITSGANTTATMNVSSGAILQPIFNGEVLANILTYPGVWSIAFTNTPPTAGQVLTAINGSYAHWATPGGGSPGSPNLSLQYNLSGTFAGVQGTSVNSQGFVQMMATGGSTTLQLTAPGAGDDALYVPGYPGFGDGFTVIDGQATVHIVGSASGTEANLQITPSPGQQAIQILASSTPTVDILQYLVSSTLFFGISNEGDVRLPNGGIYDHTGSLGTSGQVLSSTGTQTLWMTPSGGGGGGGSSAASINGLHAWSSVPATQGAQQFPPYNNSGGPGQIGMDGLGWQGTSGTGQIGGTTVAATASYPKGIKFGTGTTGGEFSPLEAIGWSDWAFFQAVPYSLTIDTTSDYQTGLYLGQTTTTRIWIGMASNMIPLGGSSLGSDAPSWSFVGFRYSTNAGDTTYQCIVQNNSTSQTIVNSGVAPDTNHHVFQVLNNGTNITFYIDGVLVGTIAFSNANVPTGQGMFAMTQIDNISSGNNVYFVADYGMFQNAGKTAAGSGGSGFSQGTNLVPGVYGTGQNTGWNGYTIYSMFHGSWLTLFPSSIQVVVQASGGTGISFNSSNQTIPGSSGASANAGVWLVATEQNSNAVLYSGGYAPVAITFHGSYQYTAAFSGVTVSTPYTLTSDPITGMTLDANHDYYVYAYFDTDSNGYNAALSLWNNPVSGSPVFLPAGYTSGIGIPNISSGGTTGGVTYATHFLVSGLQVG